LLGARARSGAPSPRPINSSLSGVSSYRVGDRLRRDRRFESGSLHRRVCEPVPREVSRAASSSRGAAPRSACPSLYCRT
jgi:hypothetical protein